MTLDDLADLLGTARLRDDEVTVLLDLARQVAHATERRNAPLTCFLAGVAVAGRADRAAAVDEVADLLRDAIG